MVLRESGKELGRANYIKKRNMSFLGSILEFVFKNKRFVF